MTATWRGREEPATPLPRGAAWLRVLRRGLPAVLLTAVCFALLLILRAAEAPLARGRRPVTGRLVQAVCRANLALIGIGLRVQGRAAGTPALVAANHGSWLDIFALNAALPVTFVAKAEVAGWPGIGWLARGTGTLFVRRDRAEAAAQVAQIAARLGAGGRIALFPEGTSTDGRRVLPFKPALLAACLPAEGAPVPVQPATIRWQAPAGARADFHGWWGGMDFGRHLLWLLAQPRTGAVTVILHPAVTPDPATGRKGVAAAAEAAVRAGLA